MCRFLIPFHHDLGNRLRNVPGCVKDVILAAGESWKSCVCENLNSFLFVDAFILQYVVCLEINKAMLYLEFLAVYGNEVGSFYMALLWLPASLGCYLRLLNNANHAPGIALFDFDIGQALMLIDFTFDYFP